MIEKIEIHSDTIKLQQFLKWSNVFESGGNAKIFIQEGKVKVNNQIEYKRGRILVPGDIVEIDNFIKLKVIKSP
jgi:ribosome-associated protein